MLGTLKRPGWLLRPARDAAAERARENGGEAAMEKNKARVAPAAATGPCRDDARVLRPTMVGPHMILISVPDHKGRSLR